MAKTDFSSTKQAVRSDFGYFNVQDTPPVSQNGVVTPATYHRQYQTFAPATYLQLQEKRLGSVTPGFNTPSRPRILPPNGFYYEKEFYGACPWTLRETRPSISGSMPIDSLSTSSYVVQFSLNYFADIAISSRVASLDRKCVIDLRNEIKSQSINAAQAVAERKQTARTVTDAAEKIAKAMTRVRRGDLRGAADALGVKVSKRAIRRNKRISNQTDAIADGWLGLNYGWQPLLNDVYGAAEALAKSQNNVEFFRMSRGTGANYSKTEVVTQPNDSAYNGDRKTAYSVNTRWQKRYTVYYRKASPPVASLASLGITNPALLAWELLPYSFVFDWFLPVGNWLSSLDATLGLEFLNGHSTVFTQYDSSYNSYLFRQTKAEPRHVLTSSSSGSYQKITCTRAVLSSFPSVPFPPFKNPISGSHIASAMALLRQSFKR